MKRYGLLFLCVILAFSAAFVYGCAETDAAARLSKAENASDTKKTENFIEETSENAFTFEEKDGAITVTGLKEPNVQQVVIPRKINGLPVKAVSDYAFINRKDIKTFYVPNSVENIGYGAFSGCSALSDITLPFTGKNHRTEKGLKDYNFGYVFGETPYNGAKSTMQFYHKDDFNQVEMAYYYIPSSLKKVKITGVKNTLIPYAAFYNCNEIDKIVLGSEITTVGEFAFSGVIGTIEWEDPQIKVIGEHAFEDFKGEHLTIPDSVTEIKRSAYSACVNVKTFIVPDNVKKADIYAFSYNYELQSVTVGKNLDVLPVETFYFCINLKTVTLPNGLKEIEDGAFDSCKALSAIEIPASVTRINANAFKNCENLKTVNFTDPSNWRYYGIMSGGDYFSAGVISDGATAAKYLTNTFREYIWEKTPVAV